MPPARPTPYIGSRPYERTEDDRLRFFGRDREIEELVSLVLSHNVVFLYAASGAGKTSLMNAGVIPKLVEEGFDVLPRGRVRAAVPPDTVLGDTNPYVLALLSSLSPDADLASLLGRPLADHLRTLPAREDAAGRVLVIDQAEELFTFTPRDWQRHQEALFVALRDALRDGKDLRIVIITREDYLARFDDLAPILPGGLRARFHLEPLGQQAARAAVERPLAGTRWRFADGVADHLVADLSRTKLADATGEIREEPGPYVEPVQLQIVCSALWHNLPEGVEVITDEHVQRFGDVDETLQRFYEDTVNACVRKTRCDKEALARWFGEQLITPSDTRDQVFRGPRETGGLPNEVVAFLDARHLLHADERASGLWYELSHDRLIRPIRVVNDRWSIEFARARSRRRWRRRMREWAAVVLGAAVVVGGLMGGLLYLAMREHAITEGRIKELPERCGDTPEARSCKARKVLVFDFVADYYWRQGDPRKTQTLVDLLKEYQGRIAPDHGLPESSEVGTTRASRDASAAEPAVLQLSYDADRPLDEGRLRRAWRKLAAERTRATGMPLSPRIKLVQEHEPSALHGSARIVAAPGSCIDPATRVAERSIALPDRDAIALPDGDALIAPHDIEDLRLRWFFLASFWDGWKTYAHLPSSALWIAPTWTLPIWRVGDAPYEPRSREDVLVEVVANKLEDHPELVLGCEELNTLLRQAARVAKHGVDEAIAARTLEGIRLELIERAREDPDGLRYLPQVLDELAELPRARRSAPPRRGPPSVTPAMRFEPTTSAPSWLQRRIAQSLPTYEPIRVELGPQALRMLLEKGRLREPYAARLDELRSEHHLRYGVIAPGVEFVDADEGGRDERGLPGNRLRIEILGHQTPQTLPVTQDQASDKVMDVLRDGYRRHREQWVTPDTIAAWLSTLRHGERAWLQRHFSLTDLKRLARAVIGEESDKEPLDRSNTLRQAPWLARSLVFWIHAHDPGDAIELAGALRDTQRARLQRPPRRGGGHRVTSDLRRGIAALEADQIDDAERWFRGAIEVDRDAAISGFLDMYPASAPAQRVRMLHDQCGAPAQGSPRAARVASVQYEIEDLLEDRATPLDAAERQYFGMCHLWAIADRGDRPREVARLASELWAGAQADRLAHSLARLEPGAAISVWQALRDHLGADPRRRSRDLVADVAARLPADRPALKLELASWLSGFGPIDAQRALQLVEAIAPGRTERERWSRSWVSATALVRLGAHGEPAQRTQRLEVAAASLPLLTRSAPDPRSAGLAFATLADLHVARADDDHAREAIEAGIRESGVRAPFGERAFFVELGAGAEDRAREIVADLVSSAADEPATHFATAVFAIVTRHADFEATAQKFLSRTATAPHPHADRVRLMLSWAHTEAGQVQKAKQVLDERMRDIDTGTWPARLRQRDDTVWREMLVAWFAGQLPDTQVLDPLRDDASFHASGLDRIGAPRAALRCEAGFYAALRSRTNGDPTRHAQPFRTALQDVIATNEYACLEYRIARFLLGHQS